MEIRDNEKICIFTPLTTKLCRYESLRLLKNVINEKRIVGLDLSYVDECSIEFINVLKEICPSVLNTSI